MICIESTNITYAPNAGGAASPVPYAVGLVLRLGCTLESATSPGEWSRALRTIEGWVFVSYHTAVLELLELAAAQDLVVTHTAIGGTAKVLTIQDVVFGGKTVGAELLVQEFSTPTVLTSRDSRRGRDTRITGVPFLGNAASGVALDDVISEANA